MTQKAKGTKAQHRERMIEVKVRFWTDDLAGEKGYIIPKHGWTGGSVQMDRNASHGIEPGKPMVFNSLMEIPAAIEKALCHQHIKLHTLRRMADYIE